jgi:hypothetical protein
MKLTPEPQDGNLSSFSFFSDSRLRSLSSRLGNKKVNELLQRISTVISSRLKPENPVAESFQAKEKHELKIHTDSAEAAVYIRGTFYVLSILTWYNCS